MEQKIVKYVGFSKPFGSNFFLSIFNKDYKPFFQSTIFLNGDVKSVSKIYKRFQNAHRFLLKNSSIGDSAEIRYIFKNKTLRIDKFSFLWK